MMEQSQRKGNWIDSVIITSQSISIMADCYGMHITIQIQSTLESRQLAKSLALRSSSIVVLACSVHDT